ncbi:MAG: chemotaxis protein CheW [Myxococcaceae bacterium]
MSHEEPVQLCIFLAGSEEFALDLMRVEEILPPQKVTPVPGAPAFVEGVTNLRGKVIPVVDLRKQLGSGPPPPKFRPKLLVCLVGRRRVGLLVDGVSEVLRLKRSAIKPAPAMGSSQMRHVVGVCGPPEKLKLLLNLKALLQAA